MEDKSIRRLLELNRQFYADFGWQFSATRRRIQPGVRKIIAGLEGSEEILDVGCGNGELAHALLQNGFHGSYTGLDFSLPLLAEAANLPARHGFIFFEADLSSDGWDRELEAGRFTLVAAFAVLHHIPGQELRINILKKIHRLMKPGGIFTHSNWQFLNSEKLKGRIRPWEAVGVSPAEVNAGDYLLDWRSGGTGLRYVHLFSPQELGQLAIMTGFKVADTFFSDGEGGRLGLYQTWIHDEDKR